MRPIFSLTIALLLCAFAALAQSPPGINYQGVARNSDGKPISLKDISIKINIVKDNDQGEVEYSEVHSVKTNSFGLFTLVIGNGNVETGDFRFISWAVGNKWLRIEMDPDGGSAFNVMGSQEFMSVPYAFYAAYSGNAQYVAGQGIAITDGTISNTGDADNNPANEYNTEFTLGSDKKLKITDGGGTKEVDLAGIATAGVVQDLSLTGNVLGLSNSAATIDLSGYKDNTDNQDLKLTGNTLSLTNDATPIDLSSYKDNTDNQDLTLTGNTLSLTNDATPIDLSSYKDNTDSQQLTLTGTQLQITGGNIISLSPFLDNTDNQDITLAGNILSLTNDATPIDLSSYKDNTDNQTLILDPATDNLMIAGGNTISLAAYKDNTDTDQQNLSVASLGTNRTISIDRGSAVTFSIADNDNDATNELQTLAYTSATKSLSIVGGNAITIPETQNISQVLIEGNDAGGQRITNIGAPTANSDAVTKQYVDNADAALSTRISANYAFKTGFNYSNLLSIGNNIAMPLSGESFDDFNVVSATSFTATAAGTYMFFVDGSISSILGGPSISILYNGTKYPVAIASNNRYNSTFMFRLTAGQTVSLVGDGIGIGSTISGSFYGYKLL